MNMSEVILADDDVAILFKIYQYFFNTFNFL